MSDEIFRLESENAELRKKLAEYTLPNGIPTTEPSGLVAPWVTDLAKANAEIARLENENEKQRDAIDALKDLLAETQTDLRSQRGLVTSERANADQCLAELNKMGEELTKSESRLRDQILESLALKRQDYARGVADGRADVLARLRGLCSSWCNSEILQGLAAEIEAKLEYEKAVFAPSATASAPGLLSMEAIVAWGQGWDNAYPKAFKAGAEAMREACAELMRKYKLPYPSELRHLGVDLPVPELPK